MIFASRFSDDRRLKVKPRRIEVVLKHDSFPYPDQQRIVIRHKYWLTETFLALFCLQRNGCGPVCEHCMNLIHFIVVFDWLARHCQ